ncbi:procathepsin L-like isoform X1 [Zophobas morio]|uniref:procathepsin L-like isoform X1 n=1 Tax=Zophobas morio TaxID=2755281 RepID=UPI00308275B0
MKIVLILSVVALTTAIPQSTIKDQWANFKAKHNKEYLSDSDDLKRFVIFTQNLAKIEAHNTKYKNGEVSYYNAINKFGDLTADEFLAFVNRTKAPETQVPGKFRRRYVPSKQPVDDEVDWRTKNVISDIKDEGDCGSSWTFSATGAVEGQLALKTGELTPLSAQNLLDCSSDYGNTGCDGGFTDSAFDYIHDNGIMSESAYPYEGAAGACRFDPSQSVTSISGYVDVDFMSEVGLADAVANIGPIAAAIDATEALQFYYGGVFFDETCNINESDLDHGVLVVGYGRELQYDYWIVKNSWGVDWGENGFYKSVRNYGNNCGIATHASYPQL